MVMDCLKSLSGGHPDDRELRAVLDAGLPDDEDAAYRVLLDFRLALVDQFSRSEEMLDDLRSVPLLYQLVSRHLEGTISVAELKVEFRQLRPSLRLRSPEIAFELRMALAFVTREGEYVRATDQFALVRACLSTRDRLAAYWTALVPL